MKLNAIVNYHYFGFMIYIINLCEFVPKFRDVIRVLFRFVRYTLVAELLQNCYPEPSL